MRPCPLPNPHDRQGRNTFLRHLDRIRLSLGGALAGSGVQVIVWPRPGELEGAVAGFLMAYAFLVWTDRMTDREGMDG